MSNDNDRNLSRRSTVKTLASLSIGGIIAGCGGNGSDGDGDGGDGGSDGGDGGDASTPTDEMGDGETATDEMGDGETATDEPGGGQDVDTTFRNAIPSNEDPWTQANLNPYAANNWGQWLPWARLGRMHLGNSEWIVEDEESIEFSRDPNEVRIRISDGVKWHTVDDGVVDDVVAADDVFARDLNQYVFQTDLENQAVQGWRVGDDEKELVLELNPDGYLEPNLKLQLARHKFNLYREGWAKPYLERFEDASSDDEEASVREEIVQQNVTLGNDEYTAHMSGPYKMDTLAPYNAQLTRVEGHPTQDRVNWDNFETVGSQTYEALVNNLIDGGTKNIPGRIENAPSHVKQVYNGFGSSAPEYLTFSYGSGQQDPFLTIDSDGLNEPGEGVSKPTGGTAKMRHAKAHQGLFHAINFPNAKIGRFNETDAERIPDPSIPRPVSRATVESVISSDILDTLPNYYPQDLETATQRFEEAGLTKEGGKWVKPNGEQLSTHLLPHPGSIEAFTSMQQDLEDFGVAVDLQTPDWGTFGSAQSKGKFGAKSNWSNQLNALGPSLVTHMYQGRANVTYVPLEWEVPPVGEYDAEPSMTVNMGDLVSDFQTTPASEQVDRIEKAYWAYAYHMPSAMTWQRAIAEPLNTTNFNWPDHPDWEGKSRVVAEPDDADVWNSMYPSIRMLWRGVEGLDAKTE